MVKVGHEDVLPQVGFSCSGSSDSPIPVMSRDWYLQLGNRPLSAHGVSEYDLLGPAWRACVRADAPSPIRDSVPNFL